MLESINAPLKLLIAGNHDFTLDTLTFQEMVTKAGLSEGADRVLVNTVYGDYGDARKLFPKENIKTGIILLDEGTHMFTLQNGALLTIYASPYTPSLGDWGFQYHPDQGHRFDIHDVDVVMTHGPPKGIMDITDSGSRAGCSDLFAAVSRARPLMHCFGHIHEGWGAKIVAWRRKICESPSHLADIDNGKSVLIEKLSGVCPGAKRTYQTSHCSGDPVPLQQGTQTLFLNAAMEGTIDHPVHPSWTVDIELPKAR
ncbi:hypothetical protein BDV59DRAFT_189652 [Aspergillus ambiguus]|uniref:uncharacterized protein n=1 Tax=Aspergillus ambiguus TaxID=176160 RepID=UPI003CCDDDBF